MKRPKDIPQDIWNIACQVEGGRHPGDPTLVDRIAWAIWLERSFGTVANRDRIRAMQADAKDRPYGGLANGGT